MTLLTSAACNGKSVLIYRLARILFCKNRRVRISQEWPKIQNFEGDLGRDGHRNTILLIDRANDIVNYDMHAWLARNPHLRARPEFS